MKSIVLWCSLQLAEHRAAAVEARDNFTHNISLLRATHEEEKGTWMTENDTLKQENSEIR